VASVVKVVGWSRWGPGGLEPWTGPNV